MSIAFCLIVSDGAAVRAVQAAALPPTLAAAIEHHIAATMVEPSDAAVPQLDRAARTAEAQAQGYTGMFCVHCQSARTKRNGACLVCDDCRQTTGCS
ncbi:hypothetical protein [Methylobacterium brachiatum]|uniref:hypothetical protein n=1 Tax=Methylobacterium brachiatum TaxID=269660 RepID=UPI0008E27972|nr:hypothetical protein [Methylobacterium brachiatum]SFI05349.1 hypothetical protein SAMN02799642_00554 [Methylobacterium brachiatum]